MKLTTEEADSDEENARSIIAPPWPPDRFSEKTIFPLLRKVNMELAESYDVDIAPPWSDVMFWIKLISLFPEKRNEAENRIAPPGLSLSAVT
ncbi:MAG: hypothetical protein ACI4PY_00820 [Akkermansia muciniphila]